MRLISAGISSILTAILLLGSVCAYSWSGPGREMRLSLNFRRISLSEALEHLQRQTGLDLVYADDLLEGVTLTCACKDLTPDEALRHFLRATCIGYRWVNDHRVVLFQKSGHEFFSLQGYVTSHKGPVAHATVSVVGSPRQALTDSKGFFNLPKLPYRKLELRVQASDHVPAAIAFDPARDPREVAVLLTARPFVSEHLSVSRPLPVRKDASGRTEVEPEDLLRRGTASRDLFQGLRAIPGVDTGLGDAGVSVRGAQPSENLVLLDGIKLYQLDHAMGHFSALNPDAIRDVAIFKGGYPAQYGDRLAGVLDIAAKGDRLGLRELRAGFDRDLAHATALLPIGTQASLMVSGRESLSDTTIRSVSERVFATTFNQEVQSFEEFEAVSAHRDFRFEDQMARLTWRPNSEDTFAATLFRGKDHFGERIDITAFAQPFNYFSKDGTWGNEGHSIRWSHQWARGMSTRVRTTQSRFDSNFNFFQRHERQTDDGVDFSDSEEFLRHSLLRERSLEISHRLDWDHALEVGVFDTRVEVAYGEQNAEEQVEEGWDTRIHGFYLQHEWNGANGFHALGGLRGGKNESTETTFWEPRLALRYEVNQYAAIRASWGEYHQFVLRTPDTINYFEGFPTWFVAIGDAIRPGFSSHYQLGARYERDGWVWDVEAYRKDQEGSLVKLYEPLRPAFDLLQTEDEYHGVDFLLERRVGPWSSRLGYSYQKGRVIRDMANDEVRDYPTDRDQPHSLHLALAWQERRWDVLTTWRFTSGKPYEIPEVVQVRNERGQRVLELVAPEVRNDLRLPDTYQLDARVGYRFPLARAQGLVGLSATNLFDRRNITHRYYALNDRGEELIPIDVMDFGFRLSLDFQVRY